MCKYILTLSHNWFSLVYAHVKKAKKMNRHLNNLHRLAKELEVRYGDDDQLLSSVKKDIAKFQNQQASFQVNSGNTELMSDAKSYAVSSVALASQKRHQ